VANTFFELVTPTRTLFKGEAEMVACRTVDGEIAFLADHIPYIGALDCCVVRALGALPEGSGGSDASELRVAVRGGFVEVKDNRVIVLADEAVLASEVDVASAAARVGASDGPSEGEVAEGGDGAPYRVSEARWAQVLLDAAGAPSQA